MKDSNLCFRLLVAGGVVVYALILASAWSTNRALERVTGEMDVRALDMMERFWKQHVDLERRHVMAQARSLSEDTRIRSLVMVEKLDEATIEDTLKDLRIAMGASLLALLDVNGKVRGVAGAQELRAAELGSATLLSRARSDTVSDIWTLSDRVLSVAIAPVKAGGRVAAFLTIGIDLGSAALHTIEESCGGSGAVFVGDRMILSRSVDPASARAIENGLFATGAARTVVEAGGRTFRLRTLRIGDTAAAGRLVWVIPRAQGRELRRSTTAAVWIPAAAMMALILAFIALYRPRNV